MKLLLTIDSHVYKTPDNRYWCNGITDYNFLKRYLDTFDSIKVFARVKNIAENELGEKVLLSGKNVEICSLPFCRRFKEYIVSFNRYNKTIKHEVNDVDCAILRLPSIISLFTYFVYIKTKKPFAIELVADIDTGTFSIINLILKIMIKKICKKANGVSYVTKQYLQNIYPCKALLDSKSLSFTENYSSICLENSFFGKPKSFVGKRKFTIVHTSNKSNTTIKGQDVLIKAVGLLVQEGFDIHIKFIGDSEIKNYYFDVARQYNIETRIEFTGLLSSKKKIKENLQSGDFFVLPTKMEGLPRSIIEAMANGLPVISTNIAGIPELINHKYLCDPNDIQGFAKNIKFFIENPLIAEEESKNNIEIAKEYTEDKLQIRRIRFYSQLKECVSLR